MTRALRLGALSMGLSAVLAMAGCGGSSGQDKAAELAAVAKGVTGVSEANLSYKDGGGSKLIRGELRVATDNVTEGAAILDKVYAAMTPHLTGSDSNYFLTFETMTANGSLIDRKLVGLAEIPTGTTLGAKYGSGG